MCSLFSELWENANKHRTSRKKRAKDEGKKGWEDFFLLLYFVVVIVVNNKKAIPRKRPSTKHTMESFGRGLYVLLYVLYLPAGLFSNNEKNKNKNQWNLL